MIAASSFIVSDFKTEDVKAECNKAVLNPLLLFFCSIRVVIKTNNKITNKISAKSLMGRFYSRKDRSGG